MISGDIRNFEWPNTEFTHAIHAATDVIATNTPLETFDVTVSGTQYFLNFCKRANVQKILLKSLFLEKVQKMRKNWLNQ